MIITTALIGKILGAIVLIGSAGAYINRSLAPLKDLLRKLENDKHRLDDHDEQIDKLCNDNKEILKTLNVMLSHMVTNNNTGELKKRQKELTEHIIQR